MRAKLESGVSHLYAACLKNNWMFEKGVKTRNQRKIFKCLCCKPTFFCVLNFINTEKSETKNNVKEIHQKRLFNHRPMIDATYCDDDVHDQEKESFDPKLKHKTEMKNKISGEFDHTCLNLNQGNVTQTIYNHNTYNNCHSCCDNNKKILHVGIDCIRLW